MAKQEAEPSEIVKAFWLGDPSGDFVPHPGEPGYDERLAREALKNHQAEVEVLVKEL